MIKRNLPFANDDQRDLLDRVQSHAAMLGAFQPMDLVSNLNSAQLDKSMLTDVLVNLSTICEEVSAPIGSDSGNDQIYWRMRSDPRDGIIHDLREHDQLGAIAGSAQAFITDQFGTAMAQAAIEPGELLFEKSSRSREELAAIDSALSFMKEDALRSDVQSQIQRDETESSLDFILPSKLIGRDDELESLKLFVKSGPVVEVDEYTKLAGLYLLRGDGGLGKSALLAEFAKQQLAAGEKGAAVIWLDLDRPSLASTDPMELTLAFVQQLGLFWPGHRIQLKMIEDHIQKLLVSPEGKESKGERLLSLTLSYWREIVAEALPVTRPVVLILDTFEEAILHGNWNAARIMRWIDSLVNDAGFHNLRPVLSGREFEADWCEQIKDRIAVNETLRELKDKPACELLRIFLKSRGANPKSFPVRQLVEIYGGVPLRLKIIAQFLAENGPEAGRELVENPDDGKLREEFAEQFLYTRILRRIRTDDPELVQLAFPGLALRRLTVDLVQNVLAGPCDLGTISNKRAEQLVEAIAEQVWLIEDDPGDEAVRHRPDLRRKMLASTPAEMAETLRTIHERAAQYYESRSDPALPAARQAVEAMYHHMMAGSGISESIGPDRARAFLSDIGEDAVTLPRETLARLKFVAGEDLSGSEAALLDDASRDSVIDEKIVEGSKHAYFGEDLKSSTAPRRETSIDRQVSRHFVEGDVYRLASLFEPALENDFLTIPTRRRRESKTQLTETASWRCLIACLTLGDLERAFDALKTVTEDPSWEGQFFRTFDRGTKGWLRKGTALEMMARLCGWDDLVPFSPGNVIRFGGKAIRTVDEMRAMQILGKTVDARHIRISLEMIRYLRSPTVHWLHDRYSAENVQAEEFLHWMERTQVTARQPMHSLMPFTNWNVEAYLHDPLLQHVTLEEMHGPVHSLAQQAPPDFLIDFAEQVAEDAFAWPLELFGDEFAMNLKKDRHRWSVTFVQMVDYCGMLRALCEALASELDRAEGAIKMISAYQSCLSREHGTENDRIS